MKKIIAIAALLASAQASAFWDSDNGYYNTDGRFDSGSYGYSDGRGTGNGSGSGDMDTEFTMTFKGRARGDAKTDWDGNYYGNYYGDGNFDGRGYGYSNNQPYYGYGYPVAPAAPVAAAPQAETK